MLISKRRKSEIEALEAGMAETSSPKQKMSRPKRKFSTMGLIIGGIVGLLVLLIGAAVWLQPQAVSSEQRSADSRNAQKEAEAKQAISGMVAAEATHKNTDAKAKEESGFKPMSVSRNENTLTLDEQDVLNMADFYAQKKAAASSSSVEASSSTTKEAMPTEIPKSVKVVHANQSQPKTIDSRVSQKGKKVLRRCILNTGVLVGSDEAILNLFVKTGRETFDYAPDYAVYDGDVPFSIGDAVSGTLPDEGEASFVAMPGSKYYLLASQLSEGYRCRR